MPEVEVYGENEELIIKIELSFVPIPGDYVNIEREDYYKYYRVIERWVRIEQNNKAAACISVELKD